MSVPSEISSSVSIQQAKATDPEKTVWVSANAGSGKTYVLSRRVIRLLLKGTKPSQLLCLTFTKAAAAEMSNRVFELLGKWVMMDDENLRIAIGDLTGEPCKDHQIERARKLFAIALDTPGGLRIQTIHAFCESLLHQFPLEANIPGHFEMMDDLGQSLLLDEAKRNVILAGLGRTKNTAKGFLTAEKIATAFETVRQFAGDQTIDVALLQLIHQRDEFMEWIQSNGGDAVSAFAPMWDAFELTRDTNSSDLLNEFTGQSALTRADLEALRELAAAKTAKSYKPVVEKINRLLCAQDMDQVFKIKCDLFLSTDRKKGIIPGHNTFLNNEEPLKKLVEDEHVFLLDHLDRLKILENLKASEALFIIVEAMLIEYGNLKKRSGFLDFTDLISRAANLLNRNEIAQWIQYKLDKGISHVLVDEAQDTSPLQWQIIEAIISEFYAGESAKQGIRTTFIVGDEKQSIYSFQGADPDEFGKQFSKLKLDVSKIDGTLEQVPLTVSFRSTEEVLSAVDQVFSLPQNRRGLSADERIPAPHSAARQHDKGEVILWPLIYKPTKTPKTDWRKPPEEPEKLDAEVQLADQIASTIAQWVKRKERLPGRAEPIRYGDILILVRKRDRFVSAMNRALKRLALPSAGADRLKLTDHIAVEDMIALGRFATMGLDDIALAGVLKSPIFGFSEDELFDIAHNRGERKLKDMIYHLANAADDKTSFGSKLKSAAKIIDEINEFSSSLPVYEFYARLFAKTNLRQKYRQRLGHEVEEILDGFFQTTLDYDNRSGLGLGGFVEWLDSASLVLKREIDMKANEIRVITTHSSKGLEAPIVFLVDPGAKAFETRHAPSIIKTEIDDNHGYLWQPRKESRVAATSLIYDKIEKAAEEEYRRLLYVGMTRAADRLIVCGYRKEKEPEYDHWYSMIEKGLSAPAIDTKLSGSFEIIKGDERERPARQWILRDRSFTEKERKATINTDNNPVTALPKWISKVQTEAAPPRPLSPSGVLNMFDISKRSENLPQLGNDNALARGNTIHHLLQILPTITEENRDRVISSYFASSLDIYSEFEQTEIKRQVIGILDSENMKFIFAAHSRSEVELTGKIYLGEREYLVRGIVDRLIVTDKKIFIIDFKTNRYVPSSIEETPEAYLAQMALYHRLLKSIYNEKTIETKILWTQNTSLMEIGADALAKQIERLNKSLPLAS